MQTTLAIGTLKIKCIYQENVGHLLANTEYVMYSAYFNNKIII